MSILTYPDGAHTYSTYILYYLLAMMKSNQALAIMAQPRTSKQQITAIEVQSIRLRFLIHFHS